MSKALRFRLIARRRPLRSILPALVLAATLGPAPAAHAAWDAAGLAFCDTLGAQSQLRAVTDGHGGFIAAWIDDRLADARIFCQRVDSTGTARWGPQVVPIVVGPTGIDQLAAASDGQDGILLAWAADFSGGRKVYVQRLGPTGTSLWPANGIAVDTTVGNVAQSEAAIASDGSGGAIVAWVDGRNSGTAAEDVYVKRVLADGNYAWTPGGVRMTSSTSPDVAPRVLGDGAGGAWVASHEVAANTRTFFQRYNDTGTAQWVSGPVTPNSGSSVDGVMARLPASDVLVVAWRDANNDRIEGTRLEADGSFAVVAGNTLVNAAATPVAFVMQTTGASHLAFFTATSVQAMPINNQGNTAGAAISLAASQTIGAGSNVGAVSDGADGLYASWASNGAAYSRHLTSTGVASDGARIRLTNRSSPDESDPVAVGGGDLRVAWIDGRNSGTSGDDLYAQRMAPNGVTAVYFRINATTGGGTGTFSQAGGRSFVREGDSLRVKFAGLGSQRVDHVIVGPTNLGPVPSYTFHTVTADSTLQAFFSNTSWTTQVVAPPGAYRAFSVPGTFSNGAVSNLFQNLWPYDPIVWRLGHWDAADSSFLEPNGTPALTSIENGKGYWFVTAKDTTLSFSVTPTPESQFSLTLLGGPDFHRGWTQFGYPFRFPLAVSQLRLSVWPDSSIATVGNSFTDHQVLEWNPSTQSYNAVSLLLPDRAYWLWRQSTSNLDLRIPCEWYSVPAVGTDPGLVSEADWSIGVTARSGERESQLVFGAAPVPADRWNGFSTHAAPGAPGAGLSLVARVSDWGEDNGEYRSVFRPDAGTLAWEFDASGAEGLAEAVLTFGFDRVPAGRRVILSEPAAGWSREVTGEARMPLVLSGTPRRLRLEVVADGAPVTAPAPATALRAVGPNPFRDATTLAFSLARSGRLRWEVFDLAGRRVMAETRALEAGEHVVTWDGRDAAGSRVRPGLYLMRWQADGRAGSARLVRTE